MHIFLDDTRKPSDVTWTFIPTNVDWVVVRDYDQFISVVSKANNITHVSFDHDLGFGKGVPDWKERNGLHCAEFLVEWAHRTRNKLPTFTVHSLNPVGAANIRNYLNNWRN